MENKLQAVGGQHVHHQLASSSSNEKHSFLTKNKEIHNELKKREEVL